MNKKAMVLPESNEITPKEWERRKKFISFAQEDVELLKQMHFISEKYNHEIVEALYAWLFSFEETKKFFSDPDLLTHVKQAQKKYFLSLTAGNYGEDYLKNRLIIGATHRRVGIEPRWYMGTYSFYIELIIPKILTELASNTELAYRMIRSLLKIFSLDQELAMATYIAPVEETLKEREKELITNKMLAHAGRLNALSEMATGIAHELNQPLAIIQANTEALELLPIEELKGDVFTEITLSNKKQVERATTIINHMRSFTRKQPESAKKMEFLVVIKNTLSLFKQQLQAHNIELQENFAANLPQINMQTQEVEQLLISLLSNAKDALVSKTSIQEKKKIIVNLDFDTAGHKIIFEIIDNGIGMSKEVQEHCLEPFFTTKEVGEGSGLGLAIVYNIVKKQAGDLDITSRPQIGTKIRISLPIG